MSDKDSDSASSEDSEEYEKRRAEEAEAKRLADEEAARIAALPTEKELLDQALEREKALIEKEKTMKQENEELQFIVNDLARRLQNATYTIDAQRKVSNESLNKANRYRIQMETMSRKLQLEMAKNNSLFRKQTQEEQSIKYEAERAKCEQLQQDLRMSILDHSMTGRTREPQSLLKLRKKLEDTEAKQDSLKEMLSQFSILDKMTEQLSYAAQHGDVDTCLTLLSRGAGANEPDSAGFLPMHYACAAGYERVVRLFLEFGADVTSYLTGYAPCEIAARSGNHDVIRVLTQFGADVNETGKGGCPPIVSAAAGGYLETLACLLQEYHCDENATDLHGQTALHAAVKLQEPVPVIHLLLRAGVDQKLPDREGMTALQVALKLTNIPALEALGGRHLENENTGIVADQASVASDSFLDSTLGGSTSNVHNEKDITVNRQKGDLSNSPTSRGNSSLAGRIRPAKGSASESRSLKGSASSPNGMRNR